VTGCSNRTSFLFAVWRVHAHHRLLGICPHDCLRTSILHRHVSLGHWWHHLICPPFFPPVLSTGHPERRPVHLTHRVAKNGPLQQEALGICNPFAPSI
jgi:hypothetical protein